MAFSELVPLNPTAACFEELSSLPVNSPEALLQPSSSIPVSTRSLLHNKLLPLPSGLKIAHANCQSLIAHIDYFWEILHKQNLHVIIVSESWLKPSIPDRMVNLPGYSIVRHDRTCRRGGGVAAYIINDLKSKLLSSSSTVHGSAAEYLIIELEISRQRLLITVLYRPPRFGYLVDFETDITKYMADYEHVVIMDDFNNDILTKNN